MPDLPNGTVTFLFTDVEGSTRLLSELGDGYGAALAEHRRVLREAVARHAGVEVDTQGDAFFVTFSRASDAVAAADEAQRALALPVRMGVHTGTAERTEEGYVGLEVHRAARICAVAHGGQVVVSEAARTSLPHGAVVLADLGLHRLKDLAEAVRLFQLGEREFPPLRSLNATNLPVQPNPLVGRERELEEVTALLGDGARLLTLTGPGGTGKTRLALQAAAELVEAFPDGVFWVSLAAVRDPELVMPTIEQTIGANVPLAQHVDERRMLLLLDNLEQVVDAAPAITATLAQCPSLHLLVTSRILLRASGERDYAVPPLTDDAAVELFRARAVDAEPEATVREICRRLDHLPLAIELAAARTRVLRPDDLLQRLEERLPLLTSGPRDAPARQRTLRATIEWSHDLLTPGERQLFGRLAVFIGGCTLDSAETVCEATLDTLQSLVDHNLLRRTGGRFWMLETIREYAGERLELSGDGEAVRRRLAGWLLPLAESANFALESEGIERYDLVTPELPNVRAALHWAIGADAELGVRLLLALEQFWVFTSPFEARRWLDELLERGPYADELQARLLAIYGGLIFIVGDFEEGGRYQEQATEIFRRLGDERGLALMLARSAVGANLRGEHERARALCEESLALGRSLGFEKPIAQALLILAYVEMDEGRSAEAMALADDAAARAGAIGWRWWEVGSLLQAAECAFRLEGPLADGGRARRCLAAAHEIGDRRHAIYALALLARAAAAAGDRRRAGRLWGAIEAETERGPIGQWEAEHEEYARHVLVAAPDFEQGRAEGRLLSLDEAVAVALSVDSRA
jgi:predicted ATPase